MVVELSNHFSCSKALDVCSLAGYPAHRFNIFLQMRELSWMMCDTLPQHCIIRGREALHSLSLQEEAEAEQPSSEEEAQEEKNKM